jgi:hypothetical protein
MEQTNIGFLGDIMSIGVTDHSPAKVVDQRSVMGTKGRLE